jgi:hypothetical protein
MINGIEILYINDTKINNLNWDEFEVHKDPIRSLSSDGIQFRIKAKAHTDLPNTILNIGPFDIINQSNADYWINKCFFCRITIQNKATPIVFGLYPTSIERIGNYYEVVCADAYEKILSMYDMGKLAKLHGVSVSNAGIYSVYFTKLLNIVKDLLNEIITKANSASPKLKLTIIQTEIDNKAVDADYLVKKNATIVNCNVMEVAQFLLDQGWYKCPTYSFFDTFDLLKIDSNSDKFSLSYLFLNLGLLLKNESNFSTPQKPNNFLVSDTKTPFFDLNFHNLINSSKKISYDFINRGGFDTCLDDGSSEVADCDKRIEIPIIGESKENTKYKLSCLLKLINLKPDVVDVTSNTFGSLEEIKFNNFYQFIPAESYIYFPIVLNYKFTSTLSPHLTISEFNSKTGTNFSFELKMKCLQYDPKLITDSSMAQLTINGESCSKY